MRVFICLHCRKEFSCGSGKQRKFCSRSCYLIHVKPILVTKECINCGIEFSRRKHRNKWQALRFCSKKCYSEWNRGKNHPSHKGGTVNKRTGYHLICVDGKLIYRSRSVMEQHLGRKLYRHEVVHHINGNRVDDNIENLELWSTSHPPGQRIEDKVSWATKFLTEYNYSISRRINFDKVCKVNLDLKIYTKKYSKKTNYKSMRVDGKKVLVHRHMMEKCIGRKLKTHEQVHHMNGNKFDNRLENLELWSTSHPSGQRLGDKINWAVDFLNQYDYIVCTN